MPVAINCQHAKRGGLCTHHAAPRRLFGLPNCVLVYPPADPRLGGCLLVFPHARPDGYPNPPPSVLRREGSQRAYTITPRGK